MTIKSKNNITDNTNIKDILSDLLLNNKTFSTGDTNLLKLFLLIDNVRQNNIDEIVKKLIQKFGDLSSVINAPKEELIEISDISDNVATNLKVIAACTKRAATEALYKQKSVLSSWNKFLDYCRQIMAYKEVEEFNVFFLDNDLHCLSIKTLTKGTINRTAAHPREVIKLAFDLSAKNIILAHNHPSGDCKPSDADISLTNDIREVAENAGIKVIDHLIVTKGDIYSFKNEGLI